MGGHALKKCVLRRYKRAEYKVLEAEAVARARRLFRRVHVPSYFDNKEDFGDVDILVVPDGSTMARIDALLEWRAQNPDADVCREAERITASASTLPPLAATDLRRTISGNSFRRATRELHERLPAVFDSKEAVLNGMVLSLEFRGFQVDFIVVPEEKFDMARFYYGWNICGMLLGNLCSCRGLKFGVDGLWANVYYMPAIHSGTRKADSHVLGRLDFSHDIHEIADFLGLPGGAARWEEGFACLGDLFEYICGSRVFDARLFIRNYVEHDNLDTRRRVNGISAYAAFVDYVQRHHTDGGVAADRGDGVRGMDEGRIGAEGDSSHCPEEVDRRKPDGDGNRRPETESWSFFYEALDAFDRRGMFDELTRVQERKEAVRAQWQPRMMKSLLEADQRRLRSITESGAPSKSESSPTATRPWSKKQCSGVAGLLTGPEFGAMLAKFKRCVVQGRAEGGHALSQQEESSFEDWVLAQADVAEVQRALEAFLREEELLQSAN